MLQIYSPQQLSFALGKGEYAMQQKKCQNRLIFGPRSLKKTPTAAWL